MHYNISIDGKNYELELARAGSRWSCRIDGRNVEVDAVQTQPNVLSLLIGVESHEIPYESTNNRTQVSVKGKRFSAEVRDPRSLRGRARVSDDGGLKNLTASMPGKIVRVLAREGAAVEMGTGVIVVEAMKMQNEISSPKKGTVQKILVEEGQAVNAGDVLAVIE
jgi:biotin carboxyl carrier protein